ncbi:unnamed protein product [Rotaria sp. Silwood2]|nr:unnamed protein product [Rotaria sp. Silwood2]CAF4079475.1 unnamed protein product [Rotaria sp. Silwood2]CAF4198065.1 unnamed protein product [Rotaria sp. Silwood2]CAF4247500.1 unnamed protein product [Rotaria sp. Silwood2]
MNSETSSSNNHVQHTLITMCNQVVKTLHTLFLRKAITTEQYEKMMYYNQTTICSVNHLYFIPEIRHKQISIQPRITCYKEEPIHAIASFVHRRLQPFINHMIHTTFTIVKGDDVIEALERYAQKGSLRSTTLFVKIDTHDLCNTLSHHVLITALEKFLGIFVQSEYIKGTSRATMIQLVQLILENQFCIYDNKLYRQTAGGSIGSPLIKGLIDIYLYHLQHDLCSKLFNKREVVGRYLNQIFFTWNRSKDELQTLLNRINRTDPNYVHTQMTIFISNKLEYLSAEISHHEGRLQTRVYHDCNLEPYALPYLVETKINSQDHELLLRAALIRALFYCSNVDEFENERLHIEVSFILNDISMNFIRNGVHKFLYEFDLFMVDDTCINDATYQNHRRQFQEFLREMNKYTVKAREKLRQRLRQQRQRRQQQKRREQQRHRQQQRRRGQQFYEMNANKQEDKEKDENPRVLSSVIEQHIENDKNCHAKLNQLQYPTMIMTAMVQKNREKVRCDYWNMSDTEFSERLFNITKNDQHRQTKIKRWLERDVLLLQFIREHACLLADFYILKMELDLYDMYVNMTQSEFFWVSQMSPSMIQARTIDEQFLETHTDAKQHLEIIEKQFSQVKKNVINYVQRKEQQHQMSTLSITDMNLLKAFIITFIRQDQKCLHADSEQKKTSLLLNANDVRSVKEFYDLQPTSLQIRLACNIWRATIQQERAKKIKNSSKSCTTNNEEDNLRCPLQSNNNNATTVNIFSQSSIGCNNLKNPLQLILEEMYKPAKEWPRITPDTTIRDSADIIENSKKTFLSLNQQQEQNSLSMAHTDSNLNYLLMNIIENRQRTLTQRIQFTRDFDKISFNVHHNDFNNMNETNKVYDKENHDDNDNEDIEYKNNSDMLKDDGDYDADNLQFYCL